jgi:hypothetical protein
VCGKQEKKETIKEGLDDESSSEKSKKSSKRKEISV